MRCNTAAGLSFAAVVAMTTFLSFPRDAGAGAIYSASTSDGGSASGGFPVGSNGAANASSNGQGYGNEEIAVTAVGSVGAGIFQVYSCCSSNPSSSFSISVPTATATAKALMDDVTFGTSGSGPITTSLNLHLNGSMFPQASADFSGSTITDTSAIAITVDITQGAQSYAFAGASSESITATAGATTGSASSSGLLANFLTGVPGKPGDLASNGDLTTNTFTVMAGSPVTVSLAFSAMTQTSGTVAVNSSFATSLEVTNFLDTLSFATDVPVFNLAVGDIVNSVEGNIVNDQYAGVPEPSTILLLGTGLVGLGFLRRRKA